VKILAFSDLHQDVETAKAIVAASVSADVLVGAGDFGVQGVGTSITLDILQTANIPTVLVSGNHDKAEEMHQLCLAWEHVHFLHGESVTIDGIAFFGLGAETPPRETASWSEYLSEDSAKHMLKNCPDHGILITHTPPLGFADLQDDGTHEGSQAILTAIKEKKPLLNLCGHIHHSWGASSKSVDTLVHNLGPTMNWFEI
jgi:Icc-related predicted phosphoesterase